MDFKISVISFENQSYSTNAFLKTALLVVFILLSSTTIWAQGVGINSTGNEADTSAMLDIESTTKGILIPRMTSAQRLAIQLPKEGLLVFDKSTTTFWFYKGSNWVELISNANDELVDADGDTKIEVEQNADEDIIRFKLGGAETMRLEKVGFLQLNAGVQRNIAVGDRNLSLISTGVRNAAFGHETLFNNDIGSENTGIGTYALYFNTNGNGNSVLGYNAMSSSTAGNYNTAIGYEAGRVSQGDSNVFIGNRAGYNETGSQKLYINNSTDDATEALIYGEFDTDLLRINGSLNIEGEYSFPIADGTNGQVMQTDGSGNLAWISPATTSTELKDADNDTKVEVEQNADEDIIRFTLAGTEVMNLEKAGILQLNADVNDNIAVGDSSLENNTTGFANTVIGYHSLMNNTTGYFNTAIGYNSLLQNTTGGYNTAIGTKALERNTSGFNNTAIGVYVLIRNTTGADNTAIGRSALSQNLTGLSNTAIGLAAMNSNTGGNNNTAIGVSALRSNTNGYRNVGVGGSSLYQNRTGVNNTAIGFQAGNNSVAGSRNVFIGNTAGFLETGSDKLYINNSTGDATEALIYGEFDNDLLRVNGTLNIEGEYNFPTVDGTNGQVMQSDGSGNLAWVSPATTSTELQDADNDTKVEVEQNADEDIIRFTLGGTEAMRLEQNGSLNIKGEYNFPTVDGTNGQVMQSDGSGNLAWVSPATTSTELQDADNDTKVEVEQNADEDIIRFTLGGTEAMRLEQNGSLNIKGEYNFPTVDGTNGQVMQSDGSGNLTWVSPATTSTELQDADNDTKVEVEQNADEDIIRFTLAGIEVMNLEKAGILQLNADVNDNIAVGDNSLVNNTTGEFNTAIGNNSLNSNTAGGYNTALGYYSLNSNTTGKFNTAIGYGALKRNTSGFNNTAIGDKALDRNTSGFNNTAIGDGALERNTNGLFNSAIGEASLLYNTTGNYNSAFGCRALFFNKSGDFNTSLGYQSGYFSTGDSNVFIGYKAGYNETGSQKLYISNSNADETEALIYGEFDNDLLRVNGTLNIDGEYHFPRVDGANGQVMQSDGAGNVTWVSPITTLTELKDADNDTKIEVEQNADEDIIRFKLEGTEAMSLEKSGIVQLNADASLNIAVGDSSLVNNSTGTRNTAIGYESLLNNTTGFNNTAEGFNALKSNTIGAYNVANGNLALSLNTTGNSNTANGSFALSNNSTGAYNTANGSSSLSSNTSGGENSANGTFALNSNTTGSRNMASGSSALTNNTTGNNNTAIGHRAGFSSAVGNGNVFLGYSAGYNELGSNKLYISNSSNNTLIYGDFSSNFLFINGSLNVGISGDGTVVTANAYNSYSDRRLKKNIVKIDGVIEKLESLNGYYYQWKDKQDTSMQLGVIAQEIEAVLPEIVATDSLGFKSVDYSKLSAFLIEVVKTQQESIEKQKVSDEQAREDLWKYVKHLEASVEAIKSETATRNKIVQID